MSSPSVVKSVAFRYTASPELKSLLENFRLMCNDAVRIAMEGRPKSRFDLIELAYPRLKVYGLHSHYALSACEIAYSIWKNRNRKSQPYLRRPFLKLDNQSYRLNHMLLRIPTVPRQYVFLVLQGSDYHTTFTDNPGLKRGSVTITKRDVCIAFSKKVDCFEPTGYIGIDINEKNVSVSATDGASSRFDELRDVVELKEKYRDVRAKIATAIGTDRRVSKKILAKYGRRERSRTIQRMHRITKRVVVYAEAHGLGIKMEKLTGIQKLYRRGNGQGRSFRGRMNTWIFREIQRQIEYKARWIGVPVTFVNPRGTSRNCPDCGSRVVRLADRKLYCPKCDKEWDRDVLASRNIMACAVPQARPSRGSCEGERGDDGSNPPSRWREVGISSAHRTGDRTSTRAT